MAKFKGWRRAHLDSWQQLLLPRKILVLPLTVLERLLVLLVGVIIIIFTRLFCRVIVSGQENICHSGRVLYLLRHRSSFGAFLLEQTLFIPWVSSQMAMFPVNVAKQKHLMRAGFLLRYLANYFYIVELPERNLAQRSQVVRTEIEILTQRQNCSLVLFPTGRRDNPGEEVLPEFNSGVGRLVAETQPTLIFVWDNDTAGLWPKGQKWPKLSWRYWQIGQFKIPLGWRRLTVEILISKPLVIADSQSQLHQLIARHPLSQVGWPVAHYLRELCWAWAVLSYPQLAGLKKPDYQQVWVDLVKII